MPRSRSPRPRAAFLVIGESAWPHAIGVAMLAAFMVLGLSARAGEDSRE
ncbi:MAG: hypothetical protein ACR2LK_02615 [Solirubrobacteraceae bacterium]